MTNLAAQTPAARALSAADVGAAAQLACLLEVSAPKPGNVSPGRHFRDMRYDDFLASAAAIGAPLAEAGRRGVGETVRHAVESTARWTLSNTNLGIVLLLAPMARAALPACGEADALPPHPAVAIANAETVFARFSRTFRPALRQVLDDTSVDDARQVYAAIRLAAPGGLGRADEQDVAAEPTLPLLAVMRLAAGRDAVAREYATGFATTFETGAPALDDARRAGLSWDDAIVETYLRLLAASSDTHIVRRGGAALAADVSRRAREVLDSGGVRSDRGRRAIDEMDRGLRDARNTANPGTTADLTAAAIFAVLLADRCGRADGGQDAVAR